MPRWAIYAFILILMGFFAIGLASTLALVSRAYADSLNPLDLLSLPNPRHSACATPPMEGASECEHPSPLLHPEFTPEYCADSVAANWILTFYAGDIATESGSRTGIDTRALNMIIDRVQHDCKISEHKAARAVGAAIGELCGKTWPCIRDDIKLGDGT
jgi:hypothetical protein